MRAFPPSGGQLYARASENAARGRRKSLAPFFLALAPFFLALAQFFRGVRFPGAMCRLWRVSNAPALPYLRPYARPCRVCVRPVCPQRVHTRYGCALPCAPACARRACPSVCRCVCPSVCDRTRMRVRSETSARPSPRALGYCIYARARAVPSTGGCADTKRRHSRHRKGLVPGFVPTLPRWLSNA